MGETESGCSRCPGQGRPGGMNAPGPQADEAGARLGLSNVRRIVVRGVNWLGDALMTTPALVRLRERFPSAHITLLTHAKLAALWTGHPAIDAVMCFGAEETLVSVARRLRREAFDMALLLPNSPRSAFEAWLGGIP